MSVESTLSALGKVTTSSFSQVCPGNVQMKSVSDASLQATLSLVSAKPTFVAVGDTLRLPYADELGL